MPIYIISAINPPVSIVNQLQKIFAKLFWGNSIGVKNKHWLFWYVMCYPREEGGLGLRSLHNMSRALLA